jgi:hypothetical protein
VVRVRCSAGVAVSDSWIGVSAGASARRWASIGRVDLARLGAELPAPSHRALDYRGRSCRQAEEDAGRGDTSGRSRMVRGIGIDATDHIPAKLEDEHVSGPT